VANRTVFLAEIKLSLTNDDKLAQLLVEILCEFSCVYCETYLVLIRHIHPAAAKDNELQNFPTLRIYGMLIGFRNYFFYSYDPVTNNFYFDEKICVRSRRIEGLSDMVERMYFLHAVPY